MAESNPVDTSTKITLDDSFIFNNVKVVCWEHILDYLGLRDVVALSKTCKRMLQICGRYINENFPEVQCKLEDNRIYLGYPDAIVAGHLSSFLTRMIISGDLESSLNGTSFDSLKTLLLRNVDLTDVQINYIRSVLNTIENVTLYRCIIHNHNIHEIFLNQCTKLKRLTVQGYISEHIILQHEYPSLEYFEYIYNNVDPTSDYLVTFLERNSNVKHLGIYMCQLWANRESFTNSNIQLDRLEVHSSYNCFSFISEIASFVNLLKSLYENGFYKTLHWNIYNHTEDLPEHEEMVNQIATLNVLELLRFYQDIELPRLNHLKELCLLGVGTNQMEDVAKNLISLEELFIYKASSDDIIPFFKQSKRLKSVTAIELDGPLFKNNVLDLFALNAERYKLGVTKRVVVALAEDVYLATKKRMNSNFDLIELQREDKYVIGCSGDALYKSYLI